MGLIERYIFGRLVTSFGMALAALVSVIWIVQALRLMNLVTARGQTIIIFFEITSLALPLLAVIIAPVALLIGAIFMLNGLNADSELVVISAAGGSRWKVAQPIIYASLLAAVAMLVFTTIIAPTAQHRLREEQTKINVDLIANIIRPGRFTEIETGLTFHIRDKAGDGTLVGLMIDDQRDKDIGFTYIADRANVVEVPGKTLLVMQDGDLQRVTKADGALQIVHFDDYAFDLSELTSAKTAKPVFRPSELSTWELFATSAKDDSGSNAGKFRAEIVDRFSQPLLPLAFGVIILVMLGDARTTRQGRGLAIAGTFFLALAVRALHFAASSAVVSSPAATPLAFLVPIVVIVFGTFLIATDRSLSLPTPVEWLIEALSDGVGVLWRRFFGREEGTA
jgi:lipopolysaccharide export system permease protein